MQYELNTPYFLIEEGLLAENIDGFRKALDSIWPNSIIAYSVKTNALPWIINWMRKHGVYAEVVSDEEFQLAEMCGYNADRIVFNGPIKSDRYLDKALQGGSIVNIDSKHELEFLGNHQPSIDGTIGVRVNIDPNIFDPADVGYQKDGFRFGFCEENGEFGKALEKVSTALGGNKKIGLHMHVNSITRSLDVYRKISRYVAGIIEMHNIQPAYIDIGGGFFGGVPGKTTPKEYINVIKKEFEQVLDVNKTPLIIEPGSAAIGSTFELHTSVIDIKDTIHGRIVTTDGSRIYIDPLWVKKGYMFTTDAQKGAYPRQVICGYTCMDHDRLMVLENKPELAMGDHIIYYRVGNYTATFGGPFIRPYPPIYVNNAGNLKMVRKQMTVEEYYQIETI